MVRAGFACVLAAVFALAHGVDGDICSETTTCLIQGLPGRRCDRTASTNCPPCLFEGTLSVECYPRTASGSCPSSTTSCPSSVSPSGSGSGSSATTEPPTTQPPESDSGSDSESGSGSATPAPTKKTPKPTTKKPVTTAPKTTTPAPSPTVNATEAPIVTSAPIDTNSSNESSSNLPLIVGIIGAAVVVVAVIAFFIWKRNRDDDDDSDDDDFQFKNPPATYNARGPPTYNHSNPSRAVTSPVGRVGNYGVGAQYGAARYGAAAGAGTQYGGSKYSGATQYSSGGMYGSQYGANTDYGSPTNMTGNNPDLYTGPGGVVYENRDSLADSLSSAEDSRDAWGNAVAKNNSTQASRPVPTSKTVQAQRDNRTLSNVSIEF